MVNNNVRIYPNNSGIVNNEFINCKHLWASCKALFWSFLAAARDKSKSTENHRIKIIMNIRMHNK